MEKINKAINFFEEEIVRLRKAPEINGCEMTPEWKEMLQIYNTAVEALRKQIPKKPLYVDGDCDLPLCPHCRMAIDETEDTTVCKLCRQALDWSDIV